MMRFRTLFAVFVILVALSLVTSARSASRHRGPLTLLAVVEYDEADMDHLDIVAFYADSMSGRSKAIALAAQDDDRFVVRIDVETGP